MNSLLPESAPGFDRPIAVLKHCHDRIRKQLATLEKLLAHLPRHGADEQARQAAAAVMKYFDQAAPLHHADEEQNLLPMLRAVARVLGRHVRESDVVARIGGDEFALLLWNCDEAHAVTKAVALECAADGVTVNCISPGYVWTTLVENQIPDTMAARGLTRDQVINDVLLAAQPTKQFVTVDQVAALALFLARDEAASITGANLSMDGGWTAA